MPSTRQSARLSSSQSKENLASSATDDATTGDKRKATASSPGQGASKKGKKAATPKKQKTIEQTMDVEKDDGHVGVEKDDTNAGVEKDDGNDDFKLDEDAKEAAEVEDAIKKVDEQKDVEMKEAEQGGDKAEENKDDGAAPTIAEKAENGVADPSKDEQPSAEAKEEGESTGAQAQTTEASKPAEPIVEQPKSDAPSITTEEKKETDTKPAGTTSDSANPIEEDSSRGSSIPSTILEKGLIYFFYRASVAVDQPHQVSDIARTYLVLRPLPTNASLNSGAIPDLKNARLIALPKKVLPKSERDRFMMFVEKAGASVSELKEVMQGSSYDTATVGTRQSAAMTPVGEGVYAITHVEGGGRGTSHLAYMLTLPETVGEIQESMGLAKQGSFTLSTKNPQQQGPANASLPQGPEWPKEVQDDFGGLRWLPAKPQHLEYANAQVLVIGEGDEGELGQSVAEGGKEEDGKETVKEELEQLEGEDHERVEGLKGTAAVWKDLELSSKEYPTLQTSW